MSEAFAGAVGRFLDEVTPVVEGLGSEVPAVPADRLPGDVALEAFDLACALVDADGHHSDHELQALITTFGPLLQTTLGQATPSELRATGFVTGRRSWVERPSAMFDLLVAADRRDATSASWTYYERAMAVAHEVAAIDAHVSRLELGGLERLRTTLLQAMTANGISRAGAAAPAPGAAAGGRAARAGAAAPAAGAGADVPLPPARPLEELYAELDALIGLDLVKSEVKLVADLLVVQRMRTERGLPVVAGSRHLVFTGNPGTGKTTVARLLAEIYRTLGVVTGGHLVETDRGGLVAGYVGQTATKVKEVFASALGGVLLIDEAYALARGGERDFGAEAIDTLVKLVEDHRDEIVVILAGYPAEMAVLVASNPGIESRFPRTIHFPDYTDDELVAIFEAVCRKERYEPDEAALAAVRERFAAEPRGPGFGNGRLARNLFEASVAAQASRVVRVGQPTDAQLLGLTADDVAAAAARI
jgi:Cdc6-like AAA superfamily ATPase